MVDVAASPTGVSPPPDATRVVSALGDVQAMLQGVESRVMGEFKLFATTLDNNCSTAIQGLSRDVAGLRSRQDKTEATVDKLGTDTAKLFEQMAEFERRMGVGDQDFHTMSRQVVTDDFNAPPDPRCLRANTQAEINILDLEKSLKSFASDAGIPDTNFKVVGPSLGRYFTIHFSGEGATAALRANQFWQHRKSDDGAWRNVVVPTPNSDTTVRVYIEKPQSKKDQKKAALARRLRRALRSLDTARAEKYTVRKSDSNVLFDGLLLGTINVHGPGDDEHTLQFKPSQLAATGLSRDAVAAAFASSAFESEPWV